MDKIPLFFACTSKMISSWREHQESVRSVIVSFNTIPMNINIEDSKYIIHAEPLLYKTVFVAVSQITSP